MADRSDKEHEE